jgi:hypothetical protein
VGRGPLTSSKVAMDHSGSLRYSHHMGRVFDSVCIEPGSKFSAHQRDCSHRSSVPVVSRIMARVRCRSIFHIRRIGSHISVQDAPETMGSHHDPSAAVYDDVLGVRRSLLDDYRYVRRWGSLSVALHWPRSVLACVQRDWSYRRIAGALRALAAEAWIAIAAIVISTLTFVANQVRLKRAESGEYVTSLREQMKELRDKVAELRVRNRDLTKDSNKLRDRIKDCEREKDKLTAQNLRLAVRVARIEEQDEES